jgi:hypothetical protein
MQRSPTPTEDDEAFVPTAHVRNSLDLSARSRKAAIRTFPWKLRADEIQLASPRPRPRDVDSRKTKKPRIGEHLSLSTDEATTENTLHDTTVALPPPDAPSATTAIDHADDIADSDHVMDMHSNAGVAEGSRLWTPEEDVKLTSALTNTPKNKWGKNDWTAVAALVSGRTRSQCSKRWHDTLVSNIDPATARRGKWTADEDKTLKNALLTHGGNNWEVITALVLGRTKKQCLNRWQTALDPSIGRVTARTVNWTPDEDKKLKNAVPTHGDKNWMAIAMMIPGRTKNQCRNRWHTAFVSNIDPATARTGKWTPDEDKHLKNAISRYGDKNSEAIAALVPGRTNAQCYRRWRNFLVSRIDPATARTGKWTADEDKKLKNAVLKHGGKNWKAITALVLGRTKSQCCNRWHDTLVSNIDPTTVRGQQTKTRS